MDGSSTVAVTGASGTVGRVVLEDLDGRGVSARALTRSPVTDRTGPWERFSFTEPGTWDAAFAGVGSLLLVRPPQLARVDRDVLPAVAAARDAGVRHVVFLSVLGAQHVPVLPHRRVERWLDVSGMAATHLRAANFMQNLLGPHAADLRDRDELVVPAGSARMSYVDARDVAAVAAACLVGEAPTRGAWDLTGPAAITHDEVAAALSRALGRPITYTRPSLPAYWRHARATGLGPDVTAVTSVLYSLARVGIGSRLADGVPTVLGRPATDIDGFARDHRDVWSRRPPRECGDPHQE